MVLISVDKERKIYKCELCGNEYNTFYELQTHMMFKHRNEVDNEFYIAQGFEPETKEETKKDLKKKVHEIETIDVREVYNEGDYVIKVNDNTIFRGRNYKDAFTGYIKYLYQTYKDFRIIDKNLYQLFDDLFKQFRVDASLWGDFFIEMAKQEGYNLKYTSKYKNVLDYLKAKGFIEDYYKEK